MDNFRGPKISLNWVVLIVCFFIFSIVCFYIFSIFWFSRQDKREAVENKVTAENVVAGDYSIVDSTKSDYYIYNGKTYFWLEKKYVHAADSAAHIKTIYGANDRIVPPEELRDNNE